MKKYISKTRAAQLEKSIDWLSDYKSVANEEHIIAENKSEAESGGDVELTALLKELGQINKRREEIIKKFLS